MQHICVIYVFFIKKSGWSVIKIQINMILKK